MPLLLPLVSTPLSPIGLTIPVSFTLAFRLVDCGAWTGSCVLQPALLAAFPKFGQVSGYMHDVLHWLHSEQRIAYRISALVWRTLLGLASAYMYLRELCCPIICPIVLNLFVHLTRVFSVSLSPVPPLGRIELSRSWDPRPGMVFHLSFASFLGPYLSRSSLA